MCDIVLLLLLLLLAAGARQIGRQVAWTLNSSFSIVVFLFYCFAERWGRDRAARTLRKASRTPHSASLIAANQKKKKKPNARKMLVVIIARATATTSTTGQRQRCLLCGVFKCFFYTRNVVFLFYSLVRRCAPSPFRADTEHDTQSNVLHTVFVCTAKKALISLWSCLAISLARIVLSSSCLSLSRSFSISLALSLCYSSARVHIPKPQVVNIINGREKKTNKPIIF